MIVAFPGYFTYLERLVIRDCGVSCVFRVPREACAS